MQAGPTFPKTPWLSLCRAFPADGEGLPALIRLVREPGVEALIAQARPDSGRPYGRRVLMDGPHLEAMVAQWTRGLPCAPHDHGGSSGAVRVLQGEAEHVVWAVRDGRLVEVKRHRVVAGEVLACGPGMVHSMGDAGAELPLVTLHVYAAPIDHMRVYDLEAGRTLLVDGGCGAWVPHDAPHLVRAVVEGLVAA